MKDARAAILLMLAAACVSTRGIAPAPVDHALAPLDDTPARPVVAAPASPVPLTDLHGDPLPAGALARCGTVRFRATFVRSLVFSPDGERLAVVGARHVTVMDAATGTKLWRTRIVPDHGDTYGAAFTEGRGVVAAGLDYGPDLDRREIVVRDVGTAAEIVRFTMAGRPRSSVSAALSPDGRALATVSPLGTAWSVRLVQLVRLVRLPEAEAGKALWQVTSPGGPRIPFGRVPVTFSADGKRLAAGRDEVHVRDAATGRSVRAFHRSADQDRTPIALSPRGRALALKDKDGPVRVFDVKTGAQRCELRPGEDLTYCLVFSPDGKLLASVSGPGREHRVLKRRVLELWDAASGDKLWHGEGVGMQSLAFSPDGEVLASGGGGVRMWHVATGTGLSPREAHEGPVHALGFSADGTEIASGGRIGPIRVWHAATARLVRKFGGDDGAVSLSPGAMKLAVRGVPGSVRQWDLSKGKELVNLNPPTGHGAKAVVSPDGTVGLVYLRSWWGHTSSGVERGSTCKLYLYGRDGEPFLTYEMKDIMTSALAFSPDGKVLATGNSDGTVRFLDMASGAETLKAWAQHGRVDRLIFSADGARLASGGYENELVTVWDVAAEKTMKRRSKLEGHGGGLMAITLSADGELIATATKDGTVRLWRAETGEEFLQFRASDVAVHSLAFSPCARYLATGSADTTVLVWDLELLKRVRRAQPVEEARTSASSVEP